MAQSGVWSQGDSSRIVVPAVFPGEEEEEEGGREEGQQRDLLPIAARAWKSLPSSSPDCPAPVGDKKEAGMVKKTWLFPPRWRGVGWRSGENAG